jgi:hypothetical protein
MSPYLESSSLKSRKLSYSTWRNIPKDLNLYKHRSENPKSCLQSPQFDLPKCGISEQCRRKLRRNQMLASAYKDINDDASTDIRDTLTI